jgi:fructose-bisphosphate aldolase/6-deoxy-5-ketofructose 1-phosphate synthase
MIRVPLDVHPDNKKTFEANYDRMTQGSGRLMLFAGDQKIEHLNDDFYGEGISPENNNPEHMFRIATKAKIGCFATQAGLIAQYGMDYPDIPYLVKINSKSHMVGVKQKDPRSHVVSSMTRAMAMAEYGQLNIVGVGYTIYWGSEYEADMLEEAADTIEVAHELGMAAVIWAYPRGAAVTDEKDPHIIAGAAGAVACLGADFVKVNYPNPPTGGEGVSSAEALKEAVEAAGRTKLICAGGSSTSADKFFQTLHDQVHIAGASGNATGRNIHQKPLEEAIRFCNATNAITCENASVEAAMKIYEGK